MVVVKYPFNSHFKNHKIITRYLGTGIICTSIISLMTLYNYQSIEQNLLIPSSSCLFIGETMKSLTIKSTTIFMVTLQMGSFISITIFYSMMWRELKKPSTIISQRTSIDKQVLIQSLLVTTTNTLCWLPSSAIYFLSWKPIQPNY